MNSTLMRSSSKRDTSRKNTARQRLCNGWKPLFPRTYLKIHNYSCMEPLQSHSCARSSILDEAEITRLSLMIQRFRGIIYSFESVLGVICCLIPKVTGVQA